MPQQTKCVGLTLAQYWATVCNAGPVLGQHMASVLCLLVYFFLYFTCDIITIGSDTLDIVGKHRWNPCMISDDDGKVEHDMVSTVRWADS